MDARIPAADVEVMITAAVQKLCPVRDEVDDGTVVITYRTHGQAMELHALARYLERFATKRLSHEDFTANLAQDLQADVVTTWTTAGMTVNCHA